MNILFISPNSPYESIGGIERHILNLLGYYKNKPEISVSVMLPTAEKNYIEKVGNITIYFSVSLNMGNTSNNQKDISDKARLFSKEVAKIIRKHKIEVICSENFHLGLPPAHSLFLNMVAGLNNIPLVLRVHSFSKTDIQEEMINQLMWNKVSCVSKSVTGDCFHKGADIDGLSTDYLGVDTTVFNDKIDSKELKKELGLKPENKIVLTATRIIQGRKSILQEKGLINLIQAFSKISSRHPHLRLLIAVGNPPERLKKEFKQSYEMLIGYLKLHGVEENTIVKTFSLEEMPKVYGGSDIFALPSENETFGQVFTEAMASGTPVIGTKVGGIPEIIRDSHNGYLIPPNDSSALAQRIESIITNDHLRDEFIAAGAKTVNKKFTLEKQFLSFTEMLEKIVSDNKQESNKFSDLMP